MVGTSSDGRDGGGRTLALAIAGMLAGVVLAGCTQQIDDTGGTLLEIERVDPTASELEYKAGDTVGFTVRCRGSVDSDSVGAEWRRVVLGEGISEMDCSSVDPGGTHTVPVTFNRSSTQTIDASCLSFDGDQSDWIGWTGTSTRPHRALESRRRSANHHV